jgi:hypothetical protein
VFIRRSVRGGATLVPLDAAHSCSRAGDGRRRVGVGIGWLATPATQGQPSNPGAPSQNDMLGAGQRLRWPFSAGAILEARDAP